ncbi:MAG: 3-phosphoserine/phosphohydroxythreonine transaminase [Phycisphaerales bacterium]|nr:3-phosphoserine/phosphohydroxythreonine transaminase [Phycisphaerales bacterium]
MSDRIYNFSAGPAVLPEEVLKQTQKDLWNLAGSGVGLIEHSHRGKAFTKVIEEAEADCREIAGIPSKYKVLFLQGGASLQFAMVPMNLLGKHATADYILTGTWSKKAVEEAKLFGNAHVAASSKPTNFDRIPAAADIHYSARPAYVHITSNNTIFGTEWKSEPDVPPGAPLICDASSDIFSRPIDVSKYALIYAGAQKNLGPSGAVLVIIRDDMLKSVRDDIPTMLKYSTHAENNSLYNTPNTFGIYVMGQSFKWIKQIGGLKAMAERNEAKAKVIYDCIDNSDFFRGTAQPDSRSLMNICFRAPSEALEEKFIAEAKAAGFDGLKGHRSVGGMRASTYNALPPEACAKLVEFMKKFELANR